MGGLDVGKARISVAVVTKPDSSRANRLRCKEPGQKDFEVLARLVEENEVGHVVVGNPLNMDGTTGKQS
jgi:RNase H-fold protein (predicted Holliday junction resolvase)